jgi:hypothetical protein
MKIKWANGYKLQHNHSCENLRFFNRCCLHTNKDDWINILWCVFRINPIPCTVTFKFPSFFLFKPPFFILHVNSDTGYHVHMFEYVTVLHNNFWTNWVTLMNLVQILYHYQPSYLYLLTSHVNIMAVKTCEIGMMLLPLNVGSWCFIWQ